MATDEPLAATEVGTPLATVLTLHPPCPVCLCRFDGPDWDVRHTASDGEDVHEECCDVCHGDDPDHRRP